jgi:hypothetical protein
MRKLVILFTSILFCVFLFAQDILHGINYIVVEKFAVGFVLIIQMYLISSSTTGNVSWQEIYSETTNENDLFTAIIGIPTISTVGSFNYLNLKLT